MNHYQILELLNNFFNYIVLNVKEFAFIKYTVCWQITIGSIMKISILLATHSKKSQLLIQHEFKLKSFTIFAILLCSKKMQLDVDKPYAAALQFSITMKKISALKNFLMRVDVERERNREIIQKKWNFCIRINFLYYFVLSFISFFV